MKIVAEGGYSVQLGTLLAALVWDTIGTLTELSIDIANCFSIHLLPQGEGKRCTDVANRAPISEKGNHLSNNWESVVGKPIHAGISHMPITGP